MTPKEKALKLVKMFNPHTEVHRIPIYHAKKCALIAVDEVALILNGHHKDAIISPFIEYWKEVKQEIEKI